MTIYYALIMWVLTLGLATGRLDRKTRSVVVVAGCAVAIIVIQALRAHSVGVDLEAYIPAYEAMRYVDLSPRMVWLNLDRGYLVYTKVIASAGVPTQMFLAIVAATIITPVALTIRRLSTSTWLSFLLYVTLGFFVFSFSGLRQAIALALCFYGLTLIERRRPLIFVAVVVFAAGFHWSASVFLVAYPLYHMRRLDARGMSMIVGAVVTVYVFRQPLYGFIADLAGFADASDGTGVAGTLIGMILVLVLAYAFADPQSTADQGFMNLMLAALLLQAFASESNTIMRAGYYFFIPVILLIPNVISAQEDKRARVLVTYVVGVSAVLFFEWKTGSGYLDVSPYLPFWS